jgi:small-conductance mechanosensitive channel
MADVSPVAITVAAWLAGLPPWLASLALMVLAIGVALLVHGAGVALTRRLLKSRDAFWRSLVIRTRRPTRLALIAVGLALAASVAPLSPEQAALFRHGMLILVILLLGWIALSGLDIGAALYLRGFKVDVEDNLIARKHLTQVRILKRAMATFVVILTVGLALMTIGGVRQWGISLLAAGGAAGIILGLALQPLLTNLIAGIIIATTQPIRIEDAVIVEGEWGWVEEINATYVVVRLWDWRRMVLPLTYFMQTPFQNWTRESASLIGTAMIHVDYAAPVEALRAKLEEIVRASPLWDGKVVSLQVTELRERTMEVRCLASARNASQAFDLRCLIREEMVSFLKAEHPSALPRDRIDLRADLDRADRRSPT